MKTGILVLIVFCFIEQSVLLATTFSFKFFQTPFLFHHEYLELCSQGYIEICKYPEAESFRIQNMQKDFLWHLKIPTLSILSKSSETLNFNFGKNIKIAILDTKNNNFSEKQLNFIDKNFKLKKNSNFNQKSLNLNQNLFFDQTVESSLKNLPKLDLEKGFFPDFIIKNHSACSSVCIHQIAPKAEIIFIPVLNDQGYASKESLLHGLYTALSLHVDIVHLGLTVKELSKDNPVDQELLQVCQKCPCLVIASGNYASRINPLSTTSFFSVAAFDQQHLIPAFSQYQELTKSNFAMPGVDIVVPLHHLFAIKITGTSFAAALMTGCLAYLLSLPETQRVNMYQLKYILQKSCVMLHKDQWCRWINFGTPDMKQCIFSLKVLYRLRLVLSDKKFTKNFIKIVDYIVEKRKEDNFLVKNKKSYAHKRPSKKFDSNLRILVEHSINMTKEFF